MCMPPPRLAGVLLALAAALAPAPATSAEPALQALGADLQWLPGGFVAGEQPDGNSLLLRAPQGLIVFDAGRHPAHTERLRQAIAAAEPTQLQLVNSHWHLDHSGGLAALRAAFPSAELHASAAIETARSGFLQRYQQQLQQLLAAPQAGAPPTATLRAELALIEHIDAARPEHVVAASGEVELAGRRVLLGLARGVSGGDVWLYDPASRVLASGDLVTLPAPLLDTACAPQWRDDLAAIAEQPFETLLPGHGRPLDRDGFERWRAGFEALLQCAASPRAATECRDDWLQAIDPLIDPEQRALGSTLLDYYLGLLRDPQAARRYCGTD